MRTRRALERLFIDSFWASDVIIKVRYQYQSIWKEEEETRDLFNMRHFRCIDFRCTMHGGENVNLLRKLIELRRASR